MNPEEPYLGPVPGDPGSRRRFHLIELVGQGTFGAVYLAEQQSSGGFRKKVALKLLNEEVASVRGAATRMRDEARVLGLLSHRHIVAVHDLVRVDDKWAILMDWVPGVDLEHLILALATLEGTVPVSAALEAGAAICEALTFAATATDGAGSPLGVIHRDIKPGNVRLTADGEIKVLDFGGARFSLAGREAATRSGTWIGTERYMAPERLLREGDTGAGDVYAAGATVVELILGRPLGRTPLDPVQHLELVEETLGLVRSRIEADSDAMDRVVAALRSALAHDPAQRPSAAELAVELDSLVRRVNGPTLQQFAREFVSRVDELLGREPQAASGTLLEGATAFDLPDEEVAPPPRPIREPAGERVVPALVLAAAAACALAAVAVGVGAVAVGGQLGRATADLSQAPALAAPAVDEEERGPPEARAPTPQPTHPVVFEGFPEGSAALPAAAPSPSSSRRRARGPSRATASAPSPAPPQAAPTVTSGRVDRTSVSIKDASRMSVSCGDVSESGTASVRIMNFPAGPCTIEADWLGTVHRTQVTIDQPKTIRCQVEDGRLLCS